MKGLMARKVFLYLLTIAFSFMVTMGAGAREGEKELAERFAWWPTDAAPGPVKDQERGGYWWWPTTPGKASPWGNRGYIYVRKIVFDEELRPLLIKRIIENVKIYFDFDKADLRGDALPVLENAVKVLNRHPEHNILITGNTDVRGPEAYNLRLGRRRAEAVRKFMLERGISEERIRIISRGKLDAVAPIYDIVGLQRDRNAQFMIARVQEIMIPYPEKVAYPEGKVVEEVRMVETPIRVDTREYTIRKGDTLWSIAVQEYGDGNQWRRIYGFNKDRIPNPNKLKPGLTIIIPIE